ncbi:hypothetical protein JKF63_06375 [Porcisia hertigi]|uniref:tRNA-specific 2-thiouridylase MnmA-like C-terminal domain-containing protein n=1 Tax=Porcisia hertigi TaxID=2761500 RepID=A0A836LJY6_9TRYP|nr:hypothetical protein JKF63_06375 [Porcisia hertigi]
MCATTTCVPLRIAIGLSGGVDSAVTALILQRCVYTTQDVTALRFFGSPRVPPPPLSMLQAVVEARVPLHQVFSKLVTAGELASAVAAHDASPVQYFPFFMRNWHDDNAESGWCARSRVDYDDAQRVAMELDLLPRDGTPLPLYDFSSEYAEQCFGRMLDAYAAGQTLNVDILCNSNIKFGALTSELRRTGSVFRETLLATGHYAQTRDLSCGFHSGVDEEESVTLLAQPCSAARDLNDQTVFLSRVPPSALARAIFPLGHLFTCKADVRALATHSFGRSGGTLTVRSDGGPEQSIAHISQKKTSTGICFVGPPSSATCAADTSRSARFPAFLNEYLPPPQPLSLSSAPTVFSDALTGEVLLAPQSTAEHPTGTPSQPIACHSSRNTLLETLRADYPGRLPAYAFTLGQRVRLGRRTADGQVREAFYYVAEKVLAPLPPSAVARGNPAPVRLLTEVRVVAQWNDPLLYTSQTTVTSLHWWIPLPMLHQRASTNLEHNTYRLKCHCCTRHQEALQSAIVEWHAADEELSADAGVRVRRARVLFDAPRRAVTPGQALVAYTSALTLQEEYMRSHAASHDDAASSPLEEMVVIGSGWIAPSDSPSP